MNKISLEQAEWLWAVSRGKTCAYYRSRYLVGTFPHFHFTPSMGGTCVSQIFRDCQPLLGIAYTHLSLDWPILIYGTFPDDERTFSLKSSRELSLNEITWLLFKSLSRLTKSNLTEFVDGDWSALFLKLDKEFKKAGNDAYMFSETYGRVIESIVNDSSEKVISC